VLIGTKEVARIVSKKLVIHAPDSSGTLKDWIRGFVFSITARSASALAAVFYRLLFNLIVNPPLATCDWYGSATVHCNWLLYVQSI